MKSHIANCGIPGVGVVPYGIHMCNFYSSRQDLIDGLVPYFLAGMDNDERGIWIASPPLPAIEIMVEIAKYPVLECGIRSGQFRILDAVEWYGEPAALNAEAVVQRWIDEEERTVADGHQGLRVAGNNSFIPHVNWADLMEYEKSLHNQLRDRRILACCNYHTQACRPVDMLEIVRRHDAALDRSDEYWSVSLRSPQFHHRGHREQRDARGLG